MYQTHKISSAEGIGWIDGLGILLSPIKLEIEMDNTDTDFGTWFSCLQVNLLDAGINFKDENSVREDFNAGKNMYDVCDKIIDEYA